MIPTLPTEIRDFLDRNNIVLNFDDLSAFEVQNEIIVSGCLTSEDDVDLQWEQDGADYIIFGRLIDEGDLQ